MESVEKEARKALNRLRRAVEKSQRELDTLEGALRTAEGADFPEDEYEAARAGISRIMGLVEEEGRRLEEKILQAGGLEPGRVRRS